ncbi:MAG: indolepyruvate oxidoreductase [Bacteroidetes bacterium CG2_30_33_31]|nr:MAG: indolepyruvate oxidoreductase [Bacteroidetes bacterium CG2_30_33_31]
MKINIILGGVGGQGILSIASIIGKAALSQGLYLKQSEVHGMSQRGGDVMSNLRLSSDEIFSDLIPEGQADIIIGVEPMEALRHLKFLKPDGWLVTNSRPFLNIENYTDRELIYSEINKIKHHVLIDADKIASEIGNSKVSNVVMLGAATPFLKIDENIIIDAINSIFSNKGKNLVDINIKGLKAGILEAQKMMVD